MEDQQLWPKEQVGCSEDDFGVGTGRYAVSGHAYVPEKLMRGPAQEEAKTKAGVVQRTCDCWGGWTMGDGGKKEEGRLLATLELADGLGGKLEKRSAVFSCVLSLGSRAQMQG